MLQIILFLILSCFLLLKCYRYCTYRPENFPPGPPRIPLFGAYLFLLFIDSKYLHKAIVKLCSYYQSKVIGFYFGEFLIVVGNCYDSVREILTNNDFDGRPDTFTARLRDPGFNLRGIFLTDGVFWKDQRRFSLRHLRDFGFGRRDFNFEEETRDEIQGLIDRIKEGPKFEHEKLHMKNGNCLFPHTLMAPMSNSFVQAFANERMPRQEQYKNLKAGLAATQFQFGTNEYGKWLGLMPWLRHIFPNLSGYNKVREASLGMHDFIKELVLKNLKTYEKGTIRNFLDLYIAEIKEAEEIGVNNGFLVDQICLIGVDFFMPSITVQVFQMSFLFRRLLYREDIVRKIQEEIDEVVGHGRLPGLNDRPSLPYSEATLREALRIDTLVPSAVAHLAVKDTKVQGFNIPKGSVAFPSLFAFHQDKEIWKDPENFRPERFLDENGKLSLKKDISLPFGAGKRLCAGETFSRNTMFLCLTAILQNFDLKNPGEKLPELDATRCGFIVGPEDYWIKFVPR